MKKTADQNSPSGTSVVNSAAAQASVPKVSVWLVDDDDRFRALVAERLSRHEGIECARQFSSPDAVLSTLASKPGPDAILLDIQMGDRNGLDAVRPIKSLARATRVLMYTTCYDLEWRERALSDGASDYLLKNDPMEKVVERLRCPAQDPAPNAYPRRRPTKRAGQSPNVNPVVDESARSLRHTLQRLRSLWN
jgi:DNA-binding NarL/FixJ family response regulator